MSKKYHLDEPSYLILEPRKGGIFLRKFEEAQGIMSATEKLLSNIAEYRNLLRFLNEKHPEILEEWKINAPG